MNSKSTHLDPIEKALMAGLALKDSNIEFIGNQTNQTVIFTQNGHSLPFNKINADVFCKLSNAFAEDKKATIAINTYFPNAISHTRKVELYTYFMWGDVDNTPDVIKGELQPSENFRESENCISLSFDSKIIRVNGQPLKSRYVKMIDAWCKGTLDTTIAEDILHIGQSTYDFHKSKLFKILGVDSKPEAVFVACKNHIPCAI